jgi:PAS domain S-box-containing protein
LVPEGHDITELRRVESQLEESLQKYHAIFNQAFTFMGVISLDGTLIEANSHALAFIEAKPEDVLQKPFWKTPWWAHSLEMQKKLQEAISKVAKGETVHFEATHEAKDGALHYIDFVLRPIKDETGKVIFMVPEGRDITELRHVEAKLQENFYKYNAIFNQTFTLMGILTLDGTLIEANPTALQSVGAKLEDVIHKPFWETPWWADSKELQQKLKEAIGKVAAGETVCFELTYKAVDGNLHYLDFVLKPIIDEKGKIIFLLPTGNDITDLRQVEKNLQKIIESKSSFTSMVSHEIRTPLTALKESISIVLEGLAGEINAKQREFLTISQQNIDRLVRFVSEVLEFQKIEDRKLVLRRKNEDIAALIGQVRDQMLPLCKKHEISLIIDVPKNMPPIYCDKDKIIQVLMNLINNSIKATEKGYIKISVNVECKCVMFCIEDTGCGIKEEDLSKLFQRYAQFGPKPGGTGLGLSISQEIIEAHYGKIWAESTLGKGTFIYFVLPLY